MDTNLSMKQSGIRPWSLIRFIRWTAEIGVPAIHAFFTFTESENLRTLKVLAAKLAVHERD